MKRRLAVASAAWVVAAGVVVAGCASGMGAAADAATTPASAAPQELVVYAAGSLRAALTDIGRDFEMREPGVQLRFVFGASGLLKDRLLAGETADVFASANMAHPQALVAAGRSSAVQRFARNRLCVLAHPQAGVSPGNVLRKLLDPQLRVGTSTPVADPSADYTWAMFRKLEARGGEFAGAYAALDRKALQLTGGPASPRPPEGRGVYAWVIDSAQADVFITYCTSVQQALGESPALQRIELPGDVNVAADYGVVALHAPAGAAPDRETQPLADRFVTTLLGTSGQAVLARWGFAAR